MKAKNIIILAVMAAVIIIAGGLLYWQSVKPSVVYNSDTTIEGNLEIPAGERYLVKNGSIITINGDLSVNGGLECENGSLSLVVSGNLRVDGELRCVRGEEAAEGDLGQGLSLAAGGNIEFTENSTVSSNGHVQIVDDSAKLAATQEAIDGIFNDAGEDSGEGLRIGPFIPINLAPGQKEAYIPPAISGNYQSAFIKDERGWLIKKLAPSAKAVFPEAARDIEGNAVPRTVKIGGQWVIGSPALPPPFDINIPTPPKDIKKIIIAYNFGPGADVNIVNLNLTGPDGRPGTSDQNASCNAKGGGGGDAFRLNARAHNLTVNNFTLRMGQGGRGGAAETQTDCDSGAAVGGRGGEPGNIKMLSAGFFRIAGEFIIIPGAGGRGG